MKAGGSGAWQGTRVQEQEYHYKRNNDDDDNDYGEGNCYDNFIIIVIIPTIMIMKTATCK